MTNDIEEALKIEKAFKTLREHPFTLISLADREKFHTGMLAFTINKLAPKKKLAFLKALWGDESCARDEFRKPKALTAAVEQNSIDLVVRNGSKPTDVILLWAEVKFKTTLSKDQLEKYKKLLPNDAIGALFALFTGVERIPDGIKEVRFQDVIVGAKDDILAGVHDADSKTLIRLWIEYLESIKSLTCHVTKVETNTINDRDFRENLDKIKLKGIFEHYRQSLFRRSVEKYMAKRSLTWDSNEVIQFNSHGNAGIEHFLHTCENKKDEGLRYGLQWQGNALKLFVSIENLQLEDTREVRLGQLLKAFKNEDLVPKGFPEKMSPGEKFRSYTIETWDIFTPELKGKSATLDEKLESTTLDELAKEYVARLAFLASHPCREIMIGGGAVLP